MPWGRFAAQREQAPSPQKAFLARRAFLLHKASSLSRNPTAAAPKSKSMRHLPQAKMPAFATSVLPDADLDLLVGYLKHMAGRKQP
jgi:hypothetical protein